MDNPWISLPLPAGLCTCPEEIVGLTVELDFGESSTTTDHPEDWVWFWVGNCKNADIIRYRVVGLKA